MLTVYTSPSCSSCRKAKKWLDAHEIKYVEKNLFNMRITYEDIDNMLRNSENGFDDIISTRSKIFKDHNLVIGDMKINELKDFIIAHPSVLKRPILIDDGKLQVGYNDEDIRVFIPHRIREIIMCNHCTVNDDCDYQLALKKYFEEIKNDVRQR